MIESVQTNTFVFRKKPKDFTPAVEVAACYIEINGKFLFLKRAIGKSEGGKWGVPAGKQESGEGSLEAVCRETYEETQIILNKNQLKFVGTLFIKKPDVEYTYHMYHQKLDCEPLVTLNNEHDEHCWLSFDEAKDFPVMAGGLETLCHFKALTNKPQLT